MDLDPLSFFANEAEKSRPQGDEGKETQETVIVSEEELKKELQVENSWIDTKKRNKKMTSTSSGLTGTVFDNTERRSSSSSSTTGLRVTNEVKETKEEAEDIPDLDDFVKVLTGETTIIKLPDVLLQLYTNKIVSGMLFMTTYRLSFLPSSSQLASLGSSNPSVYSMFNVPLSSIDKIERDKKNIQSILISCKDMRQHRIFLKGRGRVDSKSTVTLSNDEIERVFSAMYRYAFPNNIRLVFAFSGSIPNSLKESFVPFPLFDMEKELSRQGVFKSHSGRPLCWRLSTRNSTYKLCDTYPKLLVVPASIDDVQLHNIAGFRSGHRFPVLSYFYSSNGATIWRSSQPKAGVSGSNSVDERYLDLIAKSTSSKLSPTGEERKGTPLLFIIDCRPKSSALANRAAGAGYEISNNYPNTKIDFFNIGNIHVMRDSLKSMFNLLAASSSTGNDTSFGKAIEETGWLSHVRLVLKASWDCAMSVVKGVPVLVHCSHGWDRTSQVVALAQMFLDPYFRTYDGFAVLVEKDFLSFGHPFQWRCGHGYDSQTRPDNEISPIFLQFLDCCYQLVSQFPHYFEYSTKYIQVVADHVYSCRFGTFLGNCDKQRDQMGRDECVSLWSYLKYNKHALANPHYKDPLLEDTPTTHLLLPSLSKILRNVGVWKEFFFRWSAVPSFIDPPHAVSSELHDSGIMRPLLSETEEAYNQNPINHSDFDIPCISTVNDSWEALYRTERRFRATTEDPPSKQSELGISNVSMVQKNVVEECGTSDLDEELLQEIEGNDSIKILQKDEFGLLSSPSPSLMFGDDTRDDVDLLAIAALRDKEKEITDDEGEVEHDSEENDATADQISSHHVDSQQAISKNDEGDTDELREIIKRQQEEIEKLKARLLSCGAGDVDILDD